MRSQTAHRTDHAGSVAARRRMPTAYGRALAVGAISARALGPPAAVGATPQAAGHSPASSILSPSNEATVTQPFTLKVSSTEPLGALESGKDHYHLSFDGHAEQYTVDTSPEVTV